MTNEPTGNYIIASDIGSDGKLVMNFSLCVEVNLVQSFINRILAELSIPGAWVAMQTMEVEVMVQSVKVPSPSVLLQTCSLWSM